MAPAGRAGPARRCGPIRQSAYLVRDLDAAVAWWAALGVGPFLAMPRAARCRATCTGARPCDPELTLAFANSGELQIELIAGPRRRAVAVPRGARRPGRDGAHHLAWWVEDWAGWERAAAAAGWEPVTHGDGGGFAQLRLLRHRRPALAEVMELNDATRWLTDTVRTAHREWDGTTEPLRDLL